MKKYCKFMNTFINKCRNRNTEIALHCIVFIFSFIYVLNYLFLLLLIYTCVIFSPFIPALCWLEENSAPEKKSQFENGQKTRLGFFSQELHAGDSEHNSFVFPLSLSPPSVPRAAGALTLLVSQSISPVHAPCPSPRGCPHTHTQFC